MNFSSWIAGDDLTKLVVQFPIRRQSDDKKLEWNEKVTRDEQGTPYGVWFFFYRRYEPSVCYPTPLDAAFVTEFRGSLDGLKFFRK